MAAVCVVEDMVTSFGRPLRPTNVFGRLNAERSYTV